MASTYEKVSTQTLGSAAASVTFSSIPATYTDLVIIINGSTTANADTILQFNGATTNYSNLSVIGNGTSATSIFFGTGSAYVPNPTGIYIDTVNTGTGIFQYIVNVMNYANTTTFKSILSRFGAAGTGTEATVGMYRSTSAISSATISVPGTTFVTGSTFTLYGIKAA